MRKGTGEFVQKEKVINVCDNCGKELTDEHWITWDGTSSSYGDMVGDEIEVCSIDCLKMCLYDNRGVIGLYIPSDKERSISITISSSDAKELYEILCRVYL
jgi:hypothetical protein